MFKQTKKKKLYTELLKVSDRQIHIQTARQEQTQKNTDRQTDLINRQIENQTDRLTERQSSRQTGKLLDRKTVGQKE